MDKKFSIEIKDTLDDIAISYLIINIDMSIGNIVNISEKDYGYRENIIETIENEFISPKSNKLKSILDMSSEDDIWTVYELRAESFLLFVSNYTSRIYKDISGNMLSEKECDKLIRELEKRKQFLKTNNGKEIN